MNEIFAYRFKNARKMKGYTLANVAENIGVSKQMISKYEKGLSLPDSPKLIELANLFGENIDYFFRPATYKLEQIKFRKKSAYPQKKIDALKASILKQVENYLNIEDILNIQKEFVNPIENIKINSFNDAEQAAEALRKQWNLGTDPIHSIISLLEYNEIKVIEIEEDEKLFDGFSALIDNKFQVIAINKNYTIERKRFTLLHELAHLLLNINNKLADKEERLCNRFAGAMLLPESVLIKEIGKKTEKLNLNALANIQKRFGISISAIVYRLADLNIISGYKKKQYYIERNKNIKLKEFCDEVRFFGCENSDRYTQLVYKALIQEIISISKASVLLDRSIEQVQNEISVI